MWTIHIRWRVILQVVCLLQGHDWSQYLSLGPLSSADYYCRRCRKTRPNFRRFREDLGQGTVRIGTIWLDPDGNETGRTITGSNVPGDLGLR